MSKGKKIKPRVSFSRPDDATRPRSGRLMDLQDTTGKGDGERPATAEPRILVGVKMPVSLKADLKAAAARSGRTMADLVCEAVRMRLDMKDLRS